MVRKSYRELLEGEKRDRVDEKLREIGFAGGLGDLAELVERMGVVHHFNYEGYYMGAEIPWVDKTGVLLSKEDVERVRDGCSLIFRMRGLD